MSIEHTHNESADSVNTHAHNRFGGLIQTRNFRLSRTSGTNTRFTLMDRRTAAEIEFDYARVGLSMGRGDVAKFYVGEVDERLSKPHIEMTKVGDSYQHDLDNEIVSALRHIEEYNEFPTPDFVVNAATVKEVQA